MAGPFLTQFQNAIAPLIRNEDLKKSFDEFTDACDKPETEIVKSVTNLFNAVGTDLQRRGNERDWEKLQRFIEELANSDHAIQQELNNARYFAREEYNDRLLAILKGNHLLSVNQERIRFSELCAKLIASLSKDERLAGIFKQVMKDVSNRYEQMAAQSLYVDGGAEGVQLVEMILNTFKMLCIEKGIPLVNENKADKPESSEAEKSKGHFFPGPGGKPIFMPPKIHA